MPTVTVTAQKEPEDRQKVPVSVTAVTRETIDAAGIRLVSEAAILAPNTVFTEWTARKLSNARFRGIGSSPNNPGITTYIDGVPQLNANSSSIELLDVDQIEFVRGPQSALFGRNTLGGLVNVTSSRPSMAGWTGALTLPFGNHGAWTVRGGVSGPVIADRRARRRRAVQRVHAAPLGVERIDALAPAALSELQPPERRRRAARRPLRRIPRLAADAVRGVRQDRDLLPLMPSAR